MRVVPHQADYEEENYRGTRSGPAPNEKFFLRRKARGSQ